MRYFALFICILFIGCKSLNKTSNFTYHNIDEFEGVLVDEVYYDSQTGVYMSKSLINDRTLEYKNVETNIKLGEEQKKKLFNLYQSLYIPNPNRCIYDKSSGKILGKSVIRFYAIKTKWENEQCNIDVGNKKFSKLWQSIDSALVSTDIFKEAFKSDFIGK